MAYTGTVGTALKLDDKDVNDPNSGFYTAQATTEQINNIPTDAKEAGELLYNKTTGKLVLYNGIADGWETINSSAGFGSSAPVMAVNGNHLGNTETAGSYGMALNPGSVVILKQQDFSFDEGNYTRITYTGTDPIIVNYTVVISLFLVSTPSDPSNRIQFRLYKGASFIGSSIVGCITTVYEVVQAVNYTVTLTTPVSLSHNDVLWCGVAADAGPAYNEDIHYTVENITMTVTSI